MGFLNRLLGRARNRTTAKQLAYYLAGKAAETAFKGPRSFDSLFQKSGAQPQSQSRYQVELLLFAAFPFDVLIVGEQRDHADRIKAALREALVEILKQMIQPEFRHKIDWSSWTEKINARFAEYAEILHSQPARAAGLELGLRACEHATGSVDPEVAMHLALQFSGILNHLAEPIRSFEVVS